MPQVAMDLRAELARRKAASPQAGGSQATTP
jgi:hypothetical protein